MLSNLKDLYKSATLKLTAFYLTLLMATSILFSVIIYQVALSEVSTRLAGFQTGVLREQKNNNMDFDFDTIIELQAHQAATNILVSLYYINIAILIVGGFGSYFMARRTLRPIETAHEAQSRFTSDASHELRTPLAIMKLEIESALYEIAHSDQLNDNTQSVRDVLESTLEEINKLSVLSTTLLSLSRLEYKDLPRELIDLKSLFQSNFTQMTKSNKTNKDAPKQILTIRSQPDEGDMTITANLPSIEELCRILLDNALKYSPVNSIIELLLIRKRRTIEIHLTNLGVGINYTDIDHVFDRFYRASAARTYTETDTAQSYDSSIPNGYGLGLSLARQIVTVQGGTITVTSTHGVSTTFTVELPQE